MKISIDSRTVQPGDFFIPIKGENFDGRNFIQDALNKGARLLDVNLSDYAKKYRKKLSCAVIGVTGSAGKTTVKDLLHAVLSQKYKVVKTQENENNEIGAPLTLLKADFDTEILIVEMGMRGKGQIKSLASIIRPTHVVVTSIGKTHIELLKTQRNIALAKAEIMLPPVAWETTPRFAFLNYSSDYYDLLLKKAEKTGFTVYPFQGEDRIEQNIHLCFTVGHHFGLTDAEIQKGLSHYSPSAHRLQTYSLQFTLIDDSYNANPDGVIYSLDFIKRYPGRKIVVLGDMLELGSYAAKEHQRMVEYIVNSDTSILFTFGSLWSAVKVPDSMTHYAFQSKEDLIKTLKMELKPKDTVLVKGSRGMKMEDIVEALKEYTL